MCMCWYPSFWEKSPQLSSDSQKKLMALKDPTYITYTVGHAVAYKLSSERATTERWEVWANKSLPSSIQLEQLWLNFTYTYAFLRSLKTENH